MHTYVLGGVLGLWDYKGVYFYVRQIAHLDTLGRVKHRIVSRILCRIRRRKRNFDLHNKAICMFDIYICWKAQLITDFIIRLGQLFHLFICIQASSELRQLSLYRIYITWIYTRDVDTEIVYQKNNYRR